VSLCGALGSDVDALPLLVGLGIDEISAIPAAIPRLKGALRGLERGACADLTRRALELESAAAVRDLLRRASRSSAAPHPTH